MAKVKALLYCTKELNKGAYLVNCFGYRFVKMEESEKTNFDILNGKIVCECDIETKWYDTFYGCLTFREHKGLERSCLTKEQLFDYVKGLNMFNALHISNIKVFDKPRELSDYSRRINDLCYQVIGKAPQNMMYAYDFNLTPIQKYVLISIKPQWLCKILNGEKTIEVRRKVLKGMCE